MKSLQILVFILFLSGSIFGQKARKNLADQYFEYLDYSKAAPIYQELAKKTIKDGTKGKAVDWDVVRRAAETSFFAREYRAAVKYYGIMAASKASTTDDYVMYFESLRYTGEYASANKLLDSLKKLDVSDKRFAEYRRLSNYYDALKRDSARFTVRTEKFNKDLGDFGPAYYEKGIVYASNRSSGSIGRKYGWDNLGFLNVYYTEKKGDDFTKKSKQLSKNFKSTPHDGPIYFDKQFKTAFITRNRVQGDKKKGEFVDINLYISEKGENGKWGMPQSFPYNSKSYNLGHATLSPDGQTLYFASDMPGAIGGVDLWKSTRLAGGWSLPTNLGPEINTTQDEMFPYVSTDGHLYFSSKGHIGLGGLDLFESRKTPEGFSAPINMGYPLNTQYDDFALITEQNGKKGYFSSDRTDYTDRILGVTMNRILINMEGTVVDGSTNDKIDEAVVVIRNKTFGDSIVTKTNQQGEFFAPLFPECDYEFVAQKDNYTFTTPTQLSTIGMKESGTLKTELKLILGENKLKSGKKVQFVVKVKNCDNGNMIKGMSLLVIDTETGVEKLYKTDDQGAITISKNNAELPVGIEYAVVNEALEMDADGISYRPTVKKVFFIIKGSEENLSVTKEICLTPLLEGDEMVLEDIYYDYDKSNLRPLSIVRLDKAYEYMMRNPNVKIQMSSHTDSRASYQYNISLSERRAKACVDYLTKVKNIPINRLSWKGFGETRLVNGCSDNVPCSEEEHQMNRRTNLKIIQLNY